MPSPLATNELNREKQTYLKIFKDHNLTRLARARPGMIEKRINNGTQKVFEALENDTKELMDIDDTDAGELSDAPKTGVGSETDSGSTGTTDSNGNLRRYLYGSTNHLFPKRLIYSA